MSVERVSYSVSQAALAVGKSRYVLYDAIRRGDLTAYQQTPESDFSILASDLLAWLKRLPVQHPATETLDIAAQPRPGSEPNHGLSTARTPRRRPAS